MTPALIHRLRPAPARTVGVNLLVWAAVALAGGVALAAPAMRLPRFVDRVTIANPTVYALDVAVRGREPGSWLEVGRVGREATRATLELADRGDTWLFRFSHGGQAVGELAVSRAQLKAWGWRVAVPPEIGERLSAAGLGPSAR